MNDCSYILFELCKNRNPYYPSAPADQRTAQRLAEAKARLEALNEQYQHDLFELTDSMNILDYEHAHHAFLLGLDLGLSIAEARTSFEDPANSLTPP
ncbi:MAG: hypothetical protein J6A62_03320 [Oscillospiraceae bacterium]|nr:hypothetical protein [Oscillospiraceae bacterium]